MDALTRALRRLGPWLVPIVREHGFRGELAIYDGEIVRPLDKGDAAMLLAVARGDKDMVEA